MVKFPEAEKRLYRNVFVCRKCKTKTRAPNLKILSGKISCKKCGRTVFRPVRKK
jgi:hypothetical protein